MNLLEKTLSILTLSTVGINLGSCTKNIEDQLIEPKEQLFAMLRLDQYERKKEETILLVKYLIDKKGFSMHYYPFKETYDEFTPRVTFIDNPPKGVIGCDDMLELNVGVTVKETNGNQYYAPHIYQRGICIISKEDLEIFQYHARRQYGEHSI